METRPCTCGGENPNCFKCDGTGLRPTVIVTLQSIQMDAHHLLKQQEEQRLLKRKRIATSNNSSGHEKPRKKTAATSMYSAPRKRPRKAQNCGPLACPYCRVTAPTQLVLQVHLQRVHNSEGRRKDRPSQAGSDSLKSLSQDLYRIDGATGWHNAYRDRGQFGSYPMFDPMDDDSTP